MSAGGWAAHWSRGPDAPADLFNGLTPADVVPLLEELGLSIEGAPVSLDSVENRVFSFTRAGGERIVLTRRGRPVAALVPVSALEALDLLGRILPGVDLAAAGLPDVDPDAPGLGPAPAREVAP